MSRRPSSNRFCSVFISAPSADAPQPQTRPGSSWLTRAALPDRRANEAAGLSRRPALQGQAVPSYAVSGCAARGSLAQFSGRAGAGQLVLAGFAAVALSGATFARVPLAGAAGVTLARVPLSGRARPFAFARAAISGASPAGSAAAALPGASPATTQTVTPIRGVARQAAATVLGGPARALGLRKAMPTHVSAYGVSAPLGGSSRRLRLGATLAPSGVRQFRRRLGLAYRRSWLGSWRGPGCRWLGRARGWSARDVGPASRLGNRHIRQLVDRWRECGRWWLLRARE
jgi:hypothetical protein